VHAPEPVSSPPLDGAHLMALLTTQSTSETTSKEESVQFQMGAPSLLDLPPGIPSSDPSQGAGPELSLPPPALAPALPTAPPVNLAPPASRLPGNKPPPKGRSLKGEKVVYDIDVRMPFEAQPQLEVSPITLYGSDPVLVLGRQIAVNRSYICYGLRAGTIRILNINTELRVLLRGHYQRVTDMAFFAEDVHLLASASTDGRIFVRKIVEGNSEESRIIKDHILLVMQIDGEWDTVHPRVCWHSQNQDILVVGIGKYVLTVDISKVRVNAPPGGFTADDPIKFNVNSPPEGVHMVGEHTSDVTDLSVPLWIPTCFASASQDGTVRIVMVI
jgi:enhancer of mRNA-decapping protein 4